MAAITWSQVEAFAAQLADVDPDAQVTILAYVNDNVNVSALGGEGASKLTIARIHLAAHMGEIERTRNAEGGPTKRERIAADEIELEYAVLTSESSLEQTSYGREYLRLIRASAAAVGFVTGTRYRCW
jgi:hypothetical protein